ncbi:hypothetical protein SEUCBS140593_000544 [Sporothrix eucalyptigena]|uniref:Methyltransferase domain-containing protein n=1 Tax=Sporothrix eucalyptigena TaxID=1812306 RepID=A0ABP0AQM7_9PEZI
MADRYAGRSEVWGVDLAPFQPHLIPSNAKFQSLDIESHWHLGSDSWDLIHIRCLNGVVRNWPSLYNTVYDHLIPGVGHIEQIEMDWTPLDGAGPHLTNWSRTLLACMDRAGRSLRIDAAETYSALQEAGFDDIRTTCYYFPFARKGGQRTSNRDMQSPRQTSSPTASTAGTTSFSSMPSPSAFSNRSIDDGGDGNDSDDSKSVGTDVWFPRAFEQWLEGLTLMPMLRAGYSLEAVYRLLEDVRQELEDPTLNAKCTM